MSRCVWLMMLVGIAGCEKAGSKSNEDKIKDFWADAPKPTKTDGKRALRYQAASITGYTLAIDVASKPGAAMTLVVDMDMDILFGPGAKPTERDAKLGKLAMDMKAPGQDMTMKLDGDTMTVTSGGDTTTIKRGDAGILDVAAIIDKPFTTLTFGADNKVVTRGNAEHPFTSLGGDLLDTALVMFPDLPKDEIPVGHTWSITRNVAVGAGMGRVDVTYNFEYLGDGKCPSGPPTCAVLGFEASTKTTKVNQGAMTADVTYGFTGRVYFDPDKGRIDESRVKMDVDVEAQGVKLPMGGTIIMKPR